MPSNPVSPPDDDTWPYASQTLTFDWPAQERFARWSGDRNPIHMDAVYARRTQVGAPVVHGIHLVLWALEHLAATQPFTVHSLTAKFKAPAFVGEHLDLEVGAGAAGKRRIRVQGGGRTLAVIQLNADVSPSAEVAVLAAVLPGQWPETPRLVTQEQMTTQESRFELLEDPALMRWFPHLCTAIGATRVAALAGLSRLVGMICPGLYSVFNDVELAVVEPLPFDPTQTASAPLTFRAISYDERFRLVRLQVGGAGIAALLGAYLRPSPVQQPDCAAIQQRAVVSTRQFVGATALVVGGSRGLGEVTAKLLAMGGARVILTYAVGQQDADRVAEDIRRHGGDCEIRQYRIGDAPIVAAQDGTAVTHLYHFATPAIQGRRETLFQADVLTDFNRFYCDDFHRCCEALSAHGHPVRAFYPSSVAIEDPPVGWVEYAMSKAAGEVLAVELGRRLPRLQVLVHRLPRTETDQTLSMRQATAMPALDVMLPLVQQMQATV